MRGGIRYSQKLALAESAITSRAKELDFATKSIKACLARADRLYKQEPGEAFAPSRLGKHGQRWIMWLGG